MSSSASVILPPTLHVIERGWLSSNSILFSAGNGDVAGAVLIDSGYAGQSDQTLKRVDSALKSAAVGRRAPLILDRLINTHSHSDHIGGNAALQRVYGCEILIPAGIEPWIANWDEDALLLAAAGQASARFTHDATLAAGDTLRLGGLDWQALAAPGHDMHALVFYCPEKGLLISGDALWRDGFGVVFGDLLGNPEALPAARQTLEMIAALNLSTVIPGHGAAFTDVDGALSRAFRRLAIFETDRARLARNALRACFTFNLLDMQRLRRENLASYLAGIPFFVRARQHLADPEAQFSDSEFAEWLLDDLLRGRAVAIEEGWIVPKMAA